MKKNLITSMVTLALTTGMAGVASAQNPFSIDGTIPGADGGTAVVDPNGNTKELGPVNSSATKIGDINTASVPMLEFTNPNASVDLNKIYLSNARALDGHNWVYFAWFRDSVNGTGFISLEADVEASDCTYPITTKDACNPWANRQNGDALFSWDQQGNSRDIYYRVFDQTLNAGKGGFKTPASCPGTVKDLGCLLDSTVSAAAYNADFSGGELAIDLTALQVGDPNSCQLVGNVIPGTVTGNSDTADYKDVVLAPLSIDLCGKITVTKVTLDPAGKNLADTQSTFYYTIANNGAVLNPAGDTAITPAAGIKGCTLSSPSACTGPINTHADLFPGTFYTLTEDATKMPGKYVLYKDANNKGGIVCGTKDLTTGGTFTVTVGQTVVCTITNIIPPQPPTLLTAPTVKALLYDSVSITLEYPLAKGTIVSGVTFELFKNSANCAAASKVGTSRTASVTFNSGGDGTTTSTIGSTTTLDGTNNAPPAFLVITSGDTYYWKVSYPGDTYNSAGSACGEATTVSWSF